MIKFSMFNKLENFNDFTKLSKNFRNTTGFYSFSNICWVTFSKNVTKYIL